MHAVTQVAYAFRLNDLLGVQRVDGPVQALRCDGHQHAGLPTVHECPTTCRPEMKVAFQGVAVPHACSGCAIWHPSAAPILKGSPAQLSLIC